MSRVPKDAPLSYPSLRLGGALFLRDVVEQAVRRQLPGQTETDYLLPRDQKFDAEISRAWHIAQRQWEHFTMQRQRADVTPQAATEAFVIEFLRDALGYVHLSSTLPIEAEGRTYPIHHLAAPGIPLVISQHAGSLDAADPAFAVESKRHSPLQLLQDVLNASDAHQWGLVTNGLVLRLLRDAESLARPRYLALDLERLFAEGGLPDFTAAWLLLHASRCAVQETDKPCIWEQWRKRGQEQGLRLRDDLRDGVFNALLALGEGFIQHPTNERLRAALHTGTREDGTPYTRDHYFNELLRLVYRFIFLFTIEERGLLHAQDSQQEAREIYAEGYATRRMREMSARRNGYNHHSDVWQSLQVVFKGLAAGEPRLALPALGGLFQASQCPLLDDSAISNRHLLTAVRHMAWQVHSGRLTRARYADMGPEELGSVYESLLELVADPDVVHLTFGFVGITTQGETSGNERKKTGSYYTPDALVMQLISTALDPVIADRIQRNPSNPVQALLSIRVIDPACGSGHFLLAAARRLADKLAALQSPDGSLNEDDYRHALRQVITHCIYGVDRNPLAIELARTALWLEAYTPDAPLGFVDHHLVVGDALLGLLDFSALAQGMPDKLFAALSGDSKALCKQLIAANKEGRKALLRRATELDLSTSSSRPEWDELEAASDDTLADLTRKQQAWLSLQHELSQSPQAAAADLWMAALLTPKAEGTLVESIPTSADIYFTLLAQHDMSAADRVHQLEDLIESARQTCARARVLHWPLAFAPVLAAGGFDCVLGNPPWERIKLQEEEFFATRHALVAAAKNKAERSQRIEWLAQGTLARNLYPDLKHGEGEAALEREVFTAFITERRNAEATSLFAHLKPEDGARYPLTGVGDVNTYALFAETILRLIRPDGRSGFIVPTGIATDDSTKAFFEEVVTSGKLVSLFAFENEEFIFPEVHHSTRFCLLTLHGGAVRVEPEFVFFGRRISDIAQPQRRFTLAVADFLRVNPNTRTCPVFRSRADADITRGIYERVPVLVRDPVLQGDEVIEPGVNAWGIRFMRLFDMANDSPLFDVSQAEALGLTPVGATSNYQLDSGSRTFDGSSRSFSSITLPLEVMLPLYEAKMIHQFDHRHASYGVGATRATGSEAGADMAGTLSEHDKADPTRTVTARYQVSSLEVALRTAAVPAALPKALRMTGHLRGPLVKQCLDLWLASGALARGDTKLAEATLMALFSLPGDSAARIAMNVLAAKATAMEWGSTFALSDAEYHQVLTVCARYGHHMTPDRSAEPELLASAWMLLMARVPRWLMGWRDITSSHVIRTVIASVIPAAGAGDTLLLMFPDPCHGARIACLLADQCSLVHDYVARQKVGSTHLKYHVKKQLPNLPPDRYSDADIAFIVPRVLELTYTAHDLAAWAQDLTAAFPAADPRPSCPAGQAPGAAHHGQPFIFNERRRAELRAELDAWYARLYGLSREELCYILDPQSVKGEGYPSETFRVLKQNEEKEFGEYRTQRLVLAAWDALNP